MAKSSKAARVSAAKPRPSSRTSKKAPVNAKPAVRSVSVVKKQAASAKAPPVKAKLASKPMAKVAQGKPVAKPVEPAPVVVGTSPLLVALRADEQRAVRQALSGSSTLLASSPRARDAAVFAAAASVARRPVLVASPLAAELVEQAALLPGLDVAAFGAFVSPETNAASTRRLARGGPLLVVIETSQLLDEALQQLVAKTPLALVGIAAAHACSEHAHELSPAYLGLHEALRAFPAPVLATCTATNARVVQQAASAIGAAASAVIIAEPVELVRGAQVVRAAERKQALFAAISRHGSPGVVLTATAQEADSVFAELSARQVACVRAHSGMAPAERTSALKRFTDSHERLVLITQSPHANASGLAGCPEVNQCLASAPPRPDLRFVVHYQAPLSPEQLFEDLAWLPAGAASLVLADSSDAALVQALLAQQRVKPAAVEAMALALSQAQEGKPAFADTLALRAGTSRRSAERVLSAFAERNLIVRDNRQISRRASPELVTSEGRLLSAGFAALRAADAGRAELVAQYVTSRHASATAAPAEPAAPRYVRA